MNTNMKTYTVRCLSGHAYFDNVTCPMTVASGITTAGTPVELRNNVTNKEYTAMSDRVYEAGDIVVCKFKAGLVLCIVIYRDQRATGVHSNTPFNMTEVVCKVDLDEYMARQIGLAYELDIEQRHSHLRGLNTHLIREYGVRIHPMGFLEVTRPCSPGSKRSIWLVADPFETQVLLRNSVSFAAAWRTAEEAVTARGERPTYSGIYHELAKSL